ncbi:MAG: hypothetical protein SGI74_14365 [Oligoflexia bacterium]|nr:hypothetical protein [Oligoflexia bacterium]
MKTKLILTAVLLTSNMASAFELFGWFNDDPTPPTPSIEVELPASPSKVNYQEVFDSAAESLRKIENLLEQGKFGEALQASKDNLDFIRIKSGVDPKAKFNEKIKVKGILINTDLNRSFSDLSNTQRDSIAEAAAQHKRGFYLDLLNFSKRSQLLYLKAKYSILREKGTLSENDLSQIKRRLVEIVNIPIYVADANAVDVYLVFDSDMAQVEHIEMFNHEVEDFYIAATQNNSTTFFTTASQEREKTIAAHKKSVSYFSEGRFISCQNALLISTAKTFKPNLLFRDKKEVAQICSNGQAYADCVLQKVMTIKDYYRDTHIYTIEEAKNICRGN